MITPAEFVRERAAALVRSHAARLGMDSMAAGVLAGAIENIKPPETAEKRAGMAAFMERHNQVGQEIFAKLVEGTADEAEALTTLESLMLAVMLLFHPDPKDAGEFMDTMTAAVIERMGA